MARAQQRMRLVSVDGRDDDLLLVAAHQRLTLVNPNVSICFAAELFVMDANPCMHQANGEKATSDELKSYRWRYCSCLAFAPF
jgi:hypothetical protein